MTRIKLRKLSTMIRSVTSENCHRRRNAGLHVFGVVFGRNGGSAEVRTAVNTFNGISKSSHIFLKKSFCFKNYLQLGNSFKHPWQSTVLIFTTRSLYQESMKSKRFNPSYLPYSQGNPLNCKLFLLHSQFGKSLYYDADFAHVDSPFYYIQLILPFPSG